MWARTQYHRRAVAGAQPYRGSDALEPGLGGRSDILLFEDYEQTDWQSHWTGASGDFAASSDVVFAGQQSLVVRVPAGAHDGCSLEFGFAAAGLAEPDEIYFRYYVHFDSSWELSGDGEIGKLPGIAGTYGIAGWGGRPSDGTNGWSARMMNWDTGTGNAVGFYTYHADMTATYGTHMRWMPDLERNRWYCIETYARMNTISGNVGAQDGVLRGWIDGVTAFEQTDLRFRDVDTLRIEQIWFNVYVGGSWVADHDMQLHFDNVVVARDRVGCMTTPADAGVEPPVDPLADAGQGATSSGGGAGSGNTGRSRRRDRGRCRRSSGFEQQRRQRRL